MKLNEMYLRNSMAFEVRIRSMADPDNQFRGLDQYYVAEEVCYMYCIIYLLEIYANRSVFCALPYIHHCRYV